MASFNVGFSRGAERGVRLAQNATLLKLRKQQIENTERMQETQINLQKVNAVGNILQMPAATRELAFTSLAPSLNIDLKSDQGKGMMKFIKTATDEELSTARALLQFQVGDGVDIPTAVQNIANPEQLAKLIPELQRRTSSQIVGEALESVGNPEGLENLTLAVSGIDNVLASGNVRNEEQRKILETKRGDLQKQIENLRQVRSVGANSTLVTGEGDVVAEGKDVLDEIVVSPDGSTTITRGTADAVEKAGLRREATKIEDARAEINEQKVASREYFRLTNQIKKGVEKGGTPVVGILGAATSFFNQLGAQVEGFSDLVLDDGTKLNPISEFENNKGAIKLSGQINDVIKSNVVRLAYLLSKINDPSGRVARDDFENSLKQLGGSLGDPESLLNVLANNGRNILAGVDDSVKERLGEKSNFRQELLDDGVDLSLLDIDVLSDGSSTEDEGIQSILSKDPSTWTDEEFEQVKVFNGGNR